MKVVKRTGLVPVRVQKHLWPYNRGEIAGMPPARAREIIELGLGEYVEPPEDVETEETAGPAGVEAPAPSGAAEEEVEIPDDWREAHHLKRHRIATKLLGHKPANDEAAVAAIEEEVKRRETAKAGG